MILPDLIAAFDAQVRPNPVARAGQRVERIGGVVRNTGAFNFISGWDLGLTREQVAEQARTFRERGEVLLWRVYDHDGPAQLPRWLRESGFEAEAPGTLMILALEGAPPEVSPQDIEVRRVTDAARLDDYIAVSSEAFGDDEDARRRPDYVAGMADPGLALFVAYRKGVAAGSARLETTATPMFGWLFGGAVRRAHRGRGVYRALTAARAAEAWRLGIKFLITDAQETSRPILARLGFAAGPSEVTWTLPRQ